MKSTKYQAGPREHLDAEEVRGGDRTPMLDAWRQRVAKVAYDAGNDGEGATADELEQLRALGYIE